jgi:hypothetical protein
MKKNILIIGATVFLTAFQFFAQDSGVRFELVSEPGIEQNGETITVSETSNNIIVNMKVINVSGADIQVKWERVVLSTTNPNTNDQLCDDDLCYPTGSLGPNWLLNNPITIAAGDSSDFKPEVIYPVNSGGTAEFMYYIRNAANDRIDSVKVVFTSTASISNEPTVSAAKVYPNPSTGQINVKNAPTGSIIEITDMLGKVVLKRTLTGATQSFSLSNQPDGVYFYTIRSSDGTASSTKRLVLRR